MVKLTKKEVQMLDRYVEERCGELKDLIEHFQSEKLKRSYEKELQTMEEIRSKFKAELKG